MNSDFISELYQAHRDCPDCPSPGEIHDFYKQVLGILFPDHAQRSYSSASAVQNHIDELKLFLANLLQRTPENSSDDQLVGLVNTYFHSLPAIHDLLKNDVAAMNAGDPAAKSEREIIRTYPGFFAISAYRVAHALQVLGIQGIPRVITEFAHSKTGIDIHPGAKIGAYFCIDHGTGIVIGETAIIGDYVKMYQGVTLGALSVEKEDAEKKRHPTIGDRVVIYAGATILGGETTVGQDSIIGGNVWLTQSIPPASKIYYQARLITQGDQDTDQLTLKANKV